MGLFDNTRWCHFLPSPSSMLSFESVLCLAPYKLSHLRFTFRGIRPFLKMTSLAVESCWFLLVILASSAGASGEPIHKAANETICTFRPSAKTDFLTATLALVQQLGRNNVLRRQLENIQSVTPFPMIRYAWAACPSLVSRDLYRTPPCEDESRERVQSPASNGSAMERAFTHSSLTEAVTKAYSLAQHGKELQLRKSCAWARHICVRSVPSIQPSFRRSFVSQIAIIQNSPVHAEMNARLG